MHSIPDPQMPDEDWAMWRLKKKKKYEHQTVNVPAAVLHRNIWGCACMSKMGITRFPSHGKLEQKRMIPHAYWSFSFEFGPVSLSSFCFQRRNSMEPHICDDTFLQSRITRLSMKHPSLWTKWHEEKVGKKVLFSLLQYTCVFLFLQDMVVIFTKGGGRVCKHLTTAQNPKSHSPFRTWWRKKWKKWA